MWHMLSTSVSFSLLLWVAAFVLTVDSLGIGSIETGAMGIESSDFDAAASIVSFQTIGRGENSGIQDALTAVYRTQKEFDAFWATHVADGGHPPNAPPVDFTTQMVAAVFVGEQLTGGFGVEVTTVEQKEDGAFVVNFVTSVPPPGAMLTQALTQPHHVVIVDTTANAVTFEGTQAAEAPSPPIPMYIVGFEKDADFDARVTQLENDPTVERVQVMNSLRMVFVSFDSEKINKDEALAFLQSLEGVTNVEEDH